METNYKNLIVWQKSMELCKQIYLLTRELLKEELYGLTSQMQRSAISVPSNIAEGHTRNGPKEFIQFLYISKGSTAELETQLILANSLYSLDNGKVSQIESLMIEILKMLSSLIKSTQLKALSKG
jgi:four helix bundle protein